MLYFYTLSQQETSNLADFWKIWSKEIMQAMCAKVQTILSMDSRVHFDESADPRGCAKIISDYQQMSQEK